MRRNMRVFIVVISAILFLPLSVTASSAESERSDSRLGAHPWRTADTLATKKAYWSVAVDAGYNFFQGDLSSQGVAILPASRLRPFGGITFQCDFTPILGLGLGYSYANYGAKRTADDWLLWGHLHSLEAFLTVDLIDAWNHKRENTICSWYVFAGGGAGCYKSTYNDGINPIAYSSADGKYSWYGFATVGTLLEFNVSRSFGLGLKAEYHINMTDNLDTKIAGVTNDHLPYGSIQLRWKIGATNRNHIRNVSQAVFSDKQRMDGKGRSKGKGDGMGGRDTIVIAEVDTMYLAREKELIIERHHIESVETIEKSTPAFANKYNVYFANGKDNLDKFALQEIQKVASILEEDESLCVALTGYSDNTASAQLNEALTKRRAANVRKELINVYHINPDRIVSLGLGIIRNTSKGYSANRRVEMRIVTPDELDEVKLQKDSLENVYNKTKVDKTAKIGKSSYLKKSDKQVKDVNVVESVDTVREHIVETITPKVKIKPTESQVKANAAKPIATVTVEGSTTLVKLAKQYYGNGDFWPYIYEANRKVITTPTRLKPGTVIVIPRLTEKQKKTSKAALEKLAAKYLQ